MERLTRGGRAAPAGAAHRRRARRFGVVRLRAGATRTADCSTTTSDAALRRREPSDEFLDHTLAIAQLAVDLHSVARAGDIELIEVEPEPECWRRFTAGLEGVQILKPDLSVVAASR